MPIFNSVMRQINYDNPKEALAVMEKHIRALQEELEWQLMNLDSRNINEIDTSQTEIKSSDGGASIAGDIISFSSPAGERFRAGYDKAAARFYFELTDKSGANVMYYSSSGELVITKKAAVAIDGGVW